MSELRRQIRFTYANVMATIAVVVALCGAGIPQAAAAAIVSYARNSGAVDGLSATKVPRPGTLLALDEDRKFPASVLDLSSVYSKGAADRRFVTVGDPVDADTLDGLSASKYPKAGKLLPLNANGKFSASVLDLPDVDTYSRADADTRFAPKGSIVDGYSKADADARFAAKGAVVASTNADTLDGLDSTAFRKAVDAVDAATLNGQVASSFLGANAKAADADKLDGFTSADFRKAADAVDATTLNGQVATSFLAANAKAVDADKLDGFDSAAFRKTADPVDATTLNGQAASNFLTSSSKASDADKLDGIDSTGFLGAGAKAADANLLDGVDSTGFVGSATALEYGVQDRNANFTGIERFRPVAMTSRGGSSGVSGGGGLECYTGEVRLYPYNFELTGWVHTHGQTMSIAQYTALFSLLGTNYGGDGQTTFGIPDTFGLAPAGMGYQMCVNGIFPPRD